MKILLANKFFFDKGGAESSFFETVSLLERHGHRVIFFSMKHHRNLPSVFEKDFVSNIDLDTSRHWLRAGGRVLYSWEARDKIERLIRREKPDLAHLNNIYHQISPSILHLLKKLGVPTVLTLRDYKIVCASYQLFAKNRICEACSNGRYYHCALKRCMKQSLLKSLLGTTEMYLHHRVLRLYSLVHTFIAPSLFLKNQIERMGFSARVAYLPNFTSIDEAPTVRPNNENRALFFGRLSPEKGLMTLLKAAQLCADSGIGVDILGEGPLRPALAAEIKRAHISNVRLLDFQTPPKLLDTVRAASLVVLPSEWPENNPRAILEGFALSKPAVASRIGGIPELVRDGETGLTFESGNAFDLAQKLTQLALDRPAQERMGRAAQRLVANEFSPSRHYDGLMRIYENALNSGKSLTSEALR